MATIEMVVSNEKNMLQSLEKKEMQFLGIFNRYKNTLESL
jgi:hypothetical protein